MIVAIGPQLKQAAAYVSGVLKKNPSDESPSYTQAIDSLASVRLRLRNTACLNDDQKSAINVLTLALVDGSDK